MEGVSFPPTQSANAACHLVVVALAVCTVGCALPSRYLARSGTLSPPGDVVSQTARSAPAPPDFQLPAAQANQSVTQVEYLIPESGLVPIELDESAAEMPAAVTDSLDSLIVSALQSHPDVAAARQRVSATVNRVPQARALPDPMFSNTFWPIHAHALQTAGGRIGNQMSLSQQVPWPTKLSAKASVASREIEIALAEVAKVQADITEAVKLAYYELWMIEESIRIVEDNRELVDDLVTVSAARYRAGGSQQDVLRADSEADKLEDQLILLRQRREQARADLGTLVGQPLDWMASAEISAALDSTVPDLDALVAMIETCNPSLRGLAAEISRDRAKETLACLSQYPDLQFGIGWAIVSDDEEVLSPVANGHDNVNFTVGVTLPIWREKINAAQREAAHQRASTQNRKLAQRDRLRGNLRRQMAAAYAAIEQQQLLETRLIPRTQQALTIATADYQGKRTDFFNLIDFYQELLAHQVQLARTKATLASTLARIERLAGCPME